MSIPIVSCSGVSRVYEQDAEPVYALRDATFTLLEGDFVCLSGPSGSGKSTLLHLLGALDTPTSGELAIREQNICQLNERARAKLRLTEIGFIFQSHNLLPVLSVLENVRFILELQSIPLRTATEKALEALHAVGLTGLEHRRPSQLSGGQRQRVSIARAFVSKPSLIVADEPTANLDSQNAAQVLELMVHLNTEHNRTILYTTHDPQIMKYARRQLHIVDGLVSEQ